MGGSVLGTEAIYSFLEKKIKKRFLFFDNIDENKIKKLIKKEKLNNILFILISKSGSTIETLSNVLALKILNRNNLKLEKLDGMNFNVIKDEWSVSTDTSINYIVKSIKL